MHDAQYARGAVLLADFPYDSRPHQRGPREHFCLAMGAVVHEGQRYVAVCYGTSRLDNELLSAHGGAVLSVPTQFIRIHSGRMPAGVGHFVCDHVAIVPDAWVNGTFLGRFDFMKVQSRQQDPLRQRLYETYELFEPILQQGVLAGVKMLRETGRCGLPPGKKLRPSHW